MEKNGGLSRRPGWTSPAALSAATEEISELSARPGFVMPGALSTAAEEAPELSDGPEWKLLVMLLIPASLRRIEVIKES